MPPSRDDAAVFTEIFDRHRHAVHAYFLGRVADPELARDLVQEAFLRAWRRLSEIAPLPPDKQRAWIFTVARNLAIDSYRAGAARQAAEAALRHQAATEEATVAGPHLEAESRERLAQVDAAIPRAPRGAAGDPLDGHRRRADQPPDRRGPGRAGRHRPLPAQPGPQAAGGRARPGGEIMTSPARPDLDQLLAAWAAARRLPDAEAERIRQAIVPPAPPLQATWWSDFNEKISTAIARATATPGPALAALA